MADRVRVLRRLGAVRHVDHAYDQGSHNVMNRASLIIIGILWLPEPALSAPVQCGEKSTIEAAIASRFGERADRIALSGSNMVKWYVNDESGSWTMLAITPGGIACVFASGQAMQKLKPIKPGNQT